MASLELEGSDAPRVISWFITHLTMVINTINPVEGS